MIENLDLLKEKLEGVATVCEASIDGSKEYNGIHILKGNTTLWITTEGQRITHITGDEVGYGEWYDLTADELQPSKDLIEKILRGEVVEVENLGKYKKWWEA